MTYRDRLAAFPKSSRHRRMRLLVVVFAMLHIAGNGFVIMRGRAQGLYAGESLLQATIVYWIAVTLVFWTIVYFVCRFTMPLFKEKR